MKFGLVVGVAAVVYTIAIWIVFNPESQHIRFFVPVAIAVFVVPALGAWWLIFMVIRNEKAIFPIILLAFLPYGFVWYYFERRHGTRF